MKTHPRPSRSAARYCSALRSARASVASSASSSGHSAERTRAANEELADRRSMEVPHEDHEWQGEQAWPDSPGRHRDAILQPPPPQIKPAAEVAERAQELDREAGQ